MRTGKEGAASYPHLFGDLGFNLLDLPDLIDSDIVAS